jgi:3-methylcrotonyl-CoA carboxylase beta subunit
MMRAIVHLRRLAARRVPVNGPRYSIPTRWQRAPQSRAIANHAFRHHAEAISTLGTNVDTSTQDYRDNAQAFEHVMAKMKELHAKIEVGGPAKARDKHIARGKMLPRE